MRAKNLKYIMLAYLLAGCQHTQTQAEINQAYREASGYPSTSPSNFAIVAEEGKQCRAQPGKKQTNFQRYSCINKIIDRNITPTVVNQRAVRDLKNNMLSLAIRLDKKQAPRDEEAFLTEKYIQDWENAESAARAQIAQQQYSAQQAQQAQDQAEEQRRNAAWAAGLQSLGNSMQQRYQPQPQSQINCYTVNNMVGSTTRCQ